VEILSLFLLLISLSVFSLCVFSCPSFLFCCCCCCCCCCYCSFFLFVLALLPLRSLVFAALSSFSPLPPSLPPSLPRTHILTQADKGHDLDTFPPPSISSPSSSLSSSSSSFSHHTHIYKTLLSIHSLMHPPSLPPLLLRLGHRSVRRNHHRVISFVGLEGQLLQGLELLLL